MSGWHPQTRAVRGGLARSGFDETAEALYLTSGFVYESAEQAEAAFKDEVEHYIYSRYGNPTVSTFEERMRLLEGAEACFATASGMAAVFTAMAALCGNGDRVVSSRALFGSCFVILDEILPRWGVETVFVDGADLDQWREALSVPTTAVFFETPSNPMQELVDIAAVSDLAHAAGATVVVDNVFGTPVFSHPLEHGADVVIYSTTKHIDGQGRALGGAILGPKEFIDGPVKNLMRHTGPSMSPFNAWIMTKGLETLDLRVRAMAGSALTVAGTLEQWQHAGRGITRVLYPHLPSHPQHELALRQLDGGAGTVVTFDVAGGKEAALRVHERADPGRHLQQPRRLQVAHDPPGDDDAPATDAGGPGGRRHHGRNDPRVGRPRGRPRPDRGPRRRPGRSRCRRGLTRLLASPA